MIRSNGHGINDRLDAYNRKNGGHGVEALYGHDFRHHYWGDILALYVNTGDSYSETLSYSLTKMNGLKAVVWRIYSKNYLMMLDQFKGAKKWKQSN